VIKAVAFSYSNTDLIKTALAIRKEVFVEEQNIAAELEFDGLDEFANHFLLFSNSEAVATARLRSTEEGLKLERFAVLNKYRGRGYGRKLMQYIMQDGQMENSIYFHSQLSAVGFYETIGFRKVGELFYEAGIPHYKMKYTNKQ